MTFKHFALTLGFYFSIILGAFSQNTPTTLTTIIEVVGNCGMCEKRIESAALGKGVIMADWDVTTKKMTLEYDSAKTSALVVQKRIAKAGHDTTFVEAKDKTYNQLPGCCQYERMHYKEQQGDHQHHEHKH